MGEAVACQHHIDVVGEGFVGNPFFLPSCICHIASRFHGESNSSSCDGRAAVAEREREDICICMDVKSESRLLSSPLPNGAVAILSYPN